MNENIIISVGLSLLVVHEMDAVRCREWKMFFGLSNLNDDQSFQIFSYLHIPLLAAIFVGLFSISDITRYYFVWGLDLFFIIHFLLHLFFLKHKSNEFRSFFSWSIIVGMLIFGSIHFLLINTII